MKVTIFNGSPRKNGNTSTMTSSLTGMISELGAKADEHFLYQMDIKGCMNCGACQKAGDELNGCVRKDDVIRMLKEFEESDLVILATPIYMWHMTASLTAFMERMHSLCRYHNGEPINRMEGKRIAIAMTMGDDEYVAADVVNSLLMFCGYFKMEYVGAFAVPFADAEQIMRPLYQEKMRDFVKKIMK